MKGNPIKVIATKTYPQLEYMFKEGDELTLVSNLYDKDTVIVNTWYKTSANGYLIPDENGKAIILSPEVIAPKGSYINSTIITKDGREYSDTNIRNAIGYKPFSDYFKKI